MIVESLETVGQILTMVIDALLYFMALVLLIELFGFARDAVQAGGAEEHDADFSIKMVVAIALLLIAARI